MLLLLLLLGHFSRVRLCVTPWTAAHQAPSTLFDNEESLLASFMGYVFLAPTTFIWAKLFSPNNWAPLFFQNEILQFDQHYMANGILE